MHLLVVEDDRNLRQFLRNALSEEGYAVDEAESGERGLARALDHGYSCIVLDVMLPGRDGYSVVRELRKRRILTPVLMLTARADTESRVEGLEEGADDYLAKPFDLAELLARIRALIRRSDFRHEDAVISIGDITLDRLARRVTRGDVEIDLSPREFELLEFLMRNAGHTVSRSRIAEAVWRYQFDPETNVVDVYVNYLRKKLTRDGVKPPIKTVRGIGYRLEHR